MNDFITFEKLAFILFNIKFSVPRLVIGVRSKTIYEFHKEILAIPPGS